ncbi:alpha/beta fold hydrolase [Georgenia yuyongxinii]|nr:alpha/beta hydrolase [Georgenia yuyongxinii]
MATPTVLLVHGVRTSATMWRRQVEALTSVGVPVLAPDMPGHGTRTRTPYTLAGALDTIDAAAAGVQGPLVVVGMSMGGYLAVHWAAHTTHRPDAVLAASCSTQPRGPGLWAYRHVARAVGRMPDGGARLSDALARRFLPVAAQDDVAGGGMALGVMDAVLAGMAGVDMLADLEALDGMPVWLVNGRWDHFRTQERRFVRRCGNGRLVIIPRATHLVSLVQPVAFTRVVLELVEHVRAPARAA